MRNRLTSTSKTIQVHVSEVYQLFDMRDPSPFRGKDLDEDFWDYIVTSAQELSQSLAIKIVITIGQAETEVMRKSLISQAFTHHIHYQIEQKKREIKNFIRQARNYLMIGLSILWLCLWLSQKIAGMEELGLSHILAEGFVIFGWVSLWRPIELILYDWQPLVRQKRLLERLSRAELSIEFETVKSL